MLSIANYQRNTNPNYNNVSPHHAIHQKLIQYCKSIILQLKKEKDKKNVGAMGQETILENLE